jgi:FAD/FMN-containing dehydrogenase
MAAWPGMKPMTDSTVLEELRALLGPAGLVTSEHDMQPYLAEWRGLYVGRALAVALPDSTQSAAGVVRLCAARRVAIVPQGGNTGLVGGAVAQSTAERPQIVLSARRLSKIRRVDAANHAITAEAGCILSAVQAAAAEANRFFPLSLAAEGSCQLGGNISTNAGGINVLRFGTTRDLVLGLEVVLPSGQIFDGLRALRKDNTGYDLKQLFIGAEGTLGFITAATCKLFPAPNSIATALVAVATPEDAITLYTKLRSQLGDELIAFELMGHDSLAVVSRHIPQAAVQLPGQHAWYVLLETASARPPTESNAALERFLAAATEQSLILDGIVAQTGAQREALWRTRHAIPEAQRIDGPAIKHDIAVPVAEVGRFLAEASALGRRLLPGTRVIAFGHLGDGNMHFNLGQPRDLDRADFLARWGEISHAVHSLAVGMGGSFSAEHGVGLLKAGELRMFRPAVDLELMRAVKKAIDPDNIMNPGKILEI